MTLNAAECPAVFPWERGGNGPAQQGQLVSAEPAYRSRKTAPPAEAEGAADPHRFAWEACRRGRSEGGRIRIPRSFKITQYRVDPNPF